MSGIKLRTIDMNRFEVLQSLLKEVKYFKLVCGAGNENAEEVKKLTVVYALAGAKGFDVSANPEVVKACMEGIDIAINKAPQFGTEIKTRPFITVSIGMKGDHHVRKANINKDTCISCKSCIKGCPSKAIPDELVVIKDSCIGCGVCETVCPVNGTISFYHNARELNEILPLCKSAGAENFELHAAVANDEHILKEWELINKVNPDNFNSMCLDRLNLSDFALEQRIRKAKEIAGDKLIVQADGYPMSGGKDDFNTTLQAVAIADVINKRFNKSVDKRTKQVSYLENTEVNILLSGGTNSLTGILANQSDVKFQGVSLGTYARKIVDEYITHDDFVENDKLIDKALEIAKELVVKNIGEVND
jgi:Pyruvate/2-oxoacid:ferredoxin oxidoreductase delta subunit